MRISFLHTAQVHVETFNQIFQELAPEIEVHHKVSPELLTRAQANGLDDVRSETTAALHDLSSYDAVVCSCTTLGPIADAISNPHLLRIDRPVMEYACTQGPNVLVAICLEATRKSTTALFMECAVQTDQTISPEVILIDSAWSYFERGEIDNFANEIAVKVKSSIKERGNIDCVVLAQASMHVAEGLLQDLGIPVVSSPVMAAKRAIEIARQRSDRVIPKNR